MRNDFTQLPLVSIVLATYNGESFLAEQLQSLLQQTYPNIEIIAMDDGSSDNTVNILQAHAAKHGNLKVFVNKVNLGFVKNFEKGCHLSNGEFIAFCDQDDTWHLEKIQRMTAAIGDYPLIYCDSMVCSEDLQPTGVKISDVTVCRNYDNCLQYAIFARLYGHALFFKKSFFNQITPFSNVIPHDWWLAYNATLHKGFMFLPEVLVNYRQHSSNLFGIVGGSGKKNKSGNDKEDTKLSPAEESKRNKSAGKSLEKEKIRIRIKTFYNICPDKFIEEKKVLHDLVKSYESFSLQNNFRRMFIFFRYRKLLLAVKKRSLLRQYLFCLKMFVKIK